MAAKTLMVQGTGSSVGKSVLVTALCRIFAQQGLKVAPFKAQNMSLNSFVTIDGCEIGRAQAVQAEAACTPPSVDMNPVLLKPEADNCAQLIVHGKPWTRVSAAAFPQLRNSLWGAITESLENLRSRFDVIVIEGAGSPAEINLRDRDLVNMKVAIHCEAPVLLAGDIDRGGVFAALVGTLELLQPVEKERIAAFVINKFRGDLTLLTPGIDWLEKRTGVPVAGIVPYFHDIHIAEEDSMNVERRRAMKQRSDYDLDIAVLALPHIANFDDFDPLAREARVRLRYVEASDRLGEPDLLVLPGTKSTVADLGHLRTIGRDREIVKLAAAGTPIIGICGGYQMLGRTIRDPYGTESAVPETAGLALLAVSSSFARDKITHQVRARVVQRRGILERAGGGEVRGYEIHMGRTEGAGMARPFELFERSSRPCALFDGCLSADGNILGTYIHGLFHNDDFRHAVLQMLADRGGKTLPANDSGFSGDEEYDRLATLVRANLKMDLIESLLERR